VLALVANRLRLDLRIRPENSGLVAVKAPDQMIRALGCRPCRRELPSSTAAARNQGFALSALERYGRQGRIKTKEPPGMT
jgi:hypothetical protein